VRGPVFIGDICALARRQRILDEDALAEGEELDSNILLSPARRTRIFIEGVAVRRLGDRVIGDRAGISASLRVRECMSTADRVGFVVLVAGEAKVPSP
jgi:hypothetical protein